MSSSSHILEIATLAHPDGEAEAAVFVDHVKKLGSTPIGGSVELEVHGSHLVRIFGTVTMNGAVRRSGPLALVGDGSLHALLPLEALRSIVVHAPALTPKKAGGPSPAASDVLGQNLAEAKSQFSFLHGDEPGRIALSAALLA